MRKLIIHWRTDMPKKNGMRFANVHLLAGYNNATIESFQKMADDLRQTFPEAEDNEIQCCKIEESLHYRGFSLIVWNTYLPEGEYTRWSQVEGPPKYGWR